MTLARGLFAVLINIVVGGMLGAQVWGARRLMSGEPLLPRLPARPVPWSLPSVLLVVLVYLLLSIAVRIGYEIATGTANLANLGAANAGEVRGNDTPEHRAKQEPRAAARDGKGMPSFTGLMVMVSVVNALSLLAIPCLLRFTSGGTLADLGLSTLEWKRNAMIGGVAFLLVTPWVYAINALALLVFPANRHPMELMLREEFSPSVALLAVVSAVILAPAAEELIFRGVLLGWLGGTRRDGRDPTPTPDSSEFADEVPALKERSRLGEWTAIIATAFPFAVVHGSEMPAPVPIFFLALALGYVARRTGSLIPALVLHGLFNGCSTLMLLGLLLQGPGV